MRDKKEILADMKAAGVIAIGPIEDPSALIDVARALAKGGIRNLEITLRFPKALQVIEKAVDTLGDEVVIGAGTVLDAETARAAILAGAGFVVSPVFRPKVIDTCRRYDVAVMPGAMTPTEVLDAWEAGADVVKIFPAGVGGAEFFKDLKGPFPYIDIMPTGAVMRDTTSNFIKAGACAVGVGGDLIGKRLIDSRQFDIITKNAHAFVDTVKQARS